MKPVKAKAAKQLLSAGIKPGDKGKNVEVLQNYLKQFGYFNYDPVYAFDVPEKAFVHLTRQAGKFDDATEAALKAFQKKQDLPVTGVLDEATATLMNTPRCGFPDVADYSIEGRSWPRNNLTYGFQEFTGDLSQADVRTALQQSFALWSSVTRLTFMEVPFANRPDMVIRFTAGDHGDGSGFDGPGNVLAHGFYPPPNGGDLAGDIHFDEAENWSVTIPVPSNSFDLVSVAAHEIGHALGLAHSTIANSLMYAYYSGAHRFLHADDVAGIQAIYESPLGRAWQDMPGLAIDISMGADGSLFVIGKDLKPGGAGIHQWNGSAWQALDGAAVRIAVGPAGQAWVVNSNHNIFRRDGNVWTPLPGLANDIAVGADGSVYVIGTDAQPGGYGIHKWNGSAWHAIGGAAVRIAVAPNGEPWVTNSNKNIFRRQGSNWITLPGSAYDIGIGADGTPWVIGTNSTAGGYGIHRWNGSTWTAVNGGATNITVAPNGFPLVCNNAGNIFRRI